MIASSLTPTSWYLGCSLCKYFAGLHTSFDVFFPVSSLVPFWQAETTWISPLRICHHRNPVVMKVPLVYKDIYNGFIYVLFACMTELCLYSPCALMGVCIEGLQIRYYCIYVFITSLGLLQLIITFRLWCTNQGRVIVIGRYALLDPGYTLEHLRFSGNSIFLWTPFKPKGNISLLILIKKRKISYMLGTMNREIYD